MFEKICSIFVVLFFLSILISIGLESVGISVNFSFRELILASSVIHLLLEVKELKEKIKKMEKT